MKKVLIKFNDNYADEFDVSGFKVMTYDDWVEIEKDLLKSEYLKGPFETYFGSNEALLFNNAEDFLSRF
jgi:hypothetical protein